MSAPAVVGVVGAGTMGAGIAQLAAQSGARTLLADADAAARDAGLERARAGIERNRRRGRLEREPGPLEPAGGVAHLADCELVIEAVAEDIAVKRDVVSAVSRVAPGAVIATNTSSLPVTAVAAGAQDPARVVGLHFFNPPPVMRLVELVAGLDSSPEALASARAAAEAMGRHVIEVVDAPGFLVNRCGRPFGLEALKLVQDGAADAATVDRVCRLGGGFRMGPFELQDLVGMDVALQVARSFYEQSFGEPRWRPSPLVARMVAAGRLGRKSGRGWYAYGDGPHRPEDEPAPAAGGGDGRLVVVAGDLPLADELRDLAAECGFAAVEPAGAEGDVPWLVVDCGAAEDDPPLQGAPQAVLCAHGSLLALDPGGGAAGFHALPPLDECGLVELTRSATTTAAAAERTEAFVRALGRRPEWVADAPGLVLGRIVCQLINEACFAVSEAVGRPEDVDAGMVLGLNHPRGPFAWLEAAGADHVLSVLDALRHELGEERYRAAPLLRRMAVEEAS